MHSNLESARRPVPYNDDDLHIPIPLENGLQMSDEDVFPDKSTTAVEDTEVDADFKIENEDLLQKFYHGELNDLVLV